MKAVYGWLMMNPRQKQWLVLAICGVSLLAIAAMGCGPGGPGDEFPDDGRPKERNAIAEPASDRAVSRWK